MASAAGGSGAGGGDRRTPEDKKKKIGSWKKAMIRFLKKNKRKIG